MRIIFLINSLGMGGAQRVVSRLANHWAENGHEVAVMTISPKTQDFFPIHANVKRYGFALDKAASSLIGRIRDVASRMRAIDSTVADYQPDIVISFMTNMNLRALPLSLFWRVPLIISERNNPDLSYKTGATKLARRLLYPLASALVCVSHGVADACTEIKPAKKAVIYNPLEPAEPPSGQRAKTVVGVGRLAPAKGFDLLIKAFARVHAAYPDWRLQIFGEGDARDLLQALAAGTASRDSILLPGSSSTVPAELQQAGIFVLSSRFEGFPNALVEAMQAGAPVISADCPYGPSEIITPDADGILVPCEDVNALAAALADLMGNEDKRRKLGNEAFKINDRLGIKTIAGQWEAVIRQSLASHRGRNKSSHAV